MSKKNSNVILRERFRNYKELSNIYINFRKQLNKHKKKFFLIAVSGGPDSLALSYLAKCYSLENNIKASYFIVDHKLRKESSQEAENVKNTLKIAAGIDQGGFFQSGLTWVRLNPSVIVLSSILLVFTGMKGCWNSLSTIGVAQNYQPEQPIAFSHKLHAGEQGIDCNYCHHTARDSKHAGIPSVNVCMNCHTYINEGTITGKQEINKIYAAIGFDPSTRTYIPDYEQQPVEWVRVHNLPDLAYFNHSQHVVAGKVECQTCHGPVEEMEVLYQHASLTMGWCIDCHRETEVAMEGNEYYTELHDQLKEKYKGEKITVDKIGGIECAKCHY